VLGDGTVLFPAGGARVVALTVSGRVRWSVRSSGRPLTPVVDEARRLLVIADTSGTVTGYRLEPGAGAPRKIWTRDMRAESFGNPALGDDGTTYFTAGHLLAAIAPDGRLRWQVTIAQTIETGAALAEDGTVVFGGNDQFEYGIGPNGALRWRHPIGNYTYSTPLALPGDRVIYGNHSGEMTILDARSGRALEVYRGVGQIWTAAAVDRQGDVYFASRTGRIYGFRANGSRLFTIDAGGTFDSYPAIAADGTLLVGGDDGVLRAIG
jgi:outer membrane protein assembly factor BamB